LADLDRLVLGSADLRDDRVTAALLDYFHAEGGRLLDLANVYGEGESSRAVGRWLEKTGWRDSLTLYVKGCHPPYCTPALVKTEVQRARFLLGVDGLDVFILHRDDPSTPVFVFADALRQEVAAGTIASFGVSNWTVDRFDALRAELGADAHQLSVFSNHFSLATMITPTWPGCLAMTRGDIDHVEQAGPTVLAWASLAGGYFAGRDIPSWANDENQERRQRAAELAQQLDTSTAAIALAYVVNLPHRVLPVVGTRSEEHLSELISATKIELTGDQVASLAGV
jgi:aryl-alcohol dehydrogenase-like predicted oxidoreductase